jgi:6-phosphogluconolactonase/glucosamine-6-phosphate isomerase/deaminase
MLEEEVTPLFPASLLKKHSDCLVLADREASSELNPKMVAAN